MIIMYKKLLGILVIAVFLITSVGAISAADSVSVKVTWDGDAPDYVTVNLIKDGKVVDSAKLNDSNSWKTTFKVDDDGSYKVSEVVSDEYSYSVSGNANSGFVISNKLVKTDDILGASVDETIADSSADDVLEDNSSDVENSTETDDANATDDTNTTDDTNATDDETDGTDTEDESEEVTETVTSTVTEHQVTKIVEQPDKKKPVNNTTKVKNKNTGLPVAVLICAVFVAAFVPFTRKK